MLYGIRISQYLEIPHNTLLGQGNKMSFHDKLADKAVAMGKNSSEFTAAAQGHADTTWFYIIAAGVVWYFWDWQWALIPAALAIYKILQSISSTLVATKLEKHEQHAESNNPSFVGIVQAYGSILEASAPVPGTVADVSQLPYTKQEIKDAIVSALRMTEDPQIKEHLKVGYIQLADWQEGVGEANQGLDVSAIDMNQDTEDLAKAVLEQSKGSEKWASLAQQEQDVLKQELQALNLW